jgi:thioredoxin reductase (NADPH)
MAGEASFVRLFGNRESAEAWEIRDFLKRSLVEFDWCARVPG